MGLWAKFFMALKEVKKEQFRLDFCNCSFDLGEIGLGIGLVLNLYLLLLGLAFLALGDVVFMIIGKCQKVWVYVEFIAAITHHVVSKFL